MRGIRIQNEGEATRGVRVSDMATGAEIKGITSIDVRFRPGDLVTAQIGLFASEIDTQAEASFVVLHPETGVLTEVRSITFADGSTVTF